MKQYFFDYILSQGIKKEGMLNEDVRRIKLNNLLCLVSALICLLVIPIYLFWGMYLIVGLVLIMFSYFLGGIVLSRLGYSKLSRNLILILTNLFLFFGASVMGRNSGILFLYFPLVCATVFSFSSKERVLAFVFFLYYCFSIQLLEITEYSLFAGLYYLDSVSESLFTFHINVSLASSGFYVFYIFIHYQNSEEVLLKSEKTLQEIFNNSADAIFIVNFQSLLIEDCNSRAIELFEVRDKTEIINTRSTYLLRNAYKRDEMVDIAIEVKARKFKGEEVELVSRKGNAFWGNMSIKLFNIEQKELLHIRITDITERKLAEEQLKSINNELETFMYKSSHNLKGPSASIMGLINIAKKDIKDEQALKYIEMLEQSSQRLDSTLVDLLNITRIKQGGVSCEEINGEKIINNVIEGLKYYPGFGEIKIKTFVEQKRTIYSDKNLFTSIIQNLLENSIKYRDRLKVSFVNLSLTEIENQIRIEVTDNGIGIPAQLQDKIFNMFFRATETAQGSGLGLYIVKNSVNKLKGTISMESIEGKGTNFIINIPLNGEYN